MLKYDVTYTNLFTDQEVTETLYFNLSRAEIVELMVVDPHYLDRMAEIAKRADKGDENAGSDLVMAFKDLLKRSYGLRTTGNQFQKTAEISELFLSGPAYDKFLWELLMNPDRALAFFQQIFPAEVVAEAQAQGKFQPQDHLPKRTKNVFNEADLKEYEGVERVDAVSAYPEIPNGLEVDKEAQAAKTQPDVIDPDFEAYKKWRSEQG